MKLDSIRIAHTTGLVGAGWYLLCWTLVGTMPGFYMGMARSWIHGVDISGLPRNMMPFGASLYGLITFVVLAWITGYAFAAIYNALGKK